MIYQLQITLLLSGALAGGVNFFVTYLNLPFKTQDSSLAEEDWPKPKSLLLAILGYLVVGVAGAFLTPLLNALIGLKGYYPDKDFVVAFGYGIVFGYSTTKLLLSILDSLIKKISKVEAKITELEKTQSASGVQASPLIGNRSQELIYECETQFESYKDDCSGFAKVVSSKFGASITGNADNIVDQIQGPGWTKFEKDGVKAKLKADAGWLVIGGLKSGDHNPARSNGHVAIIVKGGLDHNKYPTGYWGSSGGVAEKNKTVNYAWNTSDRDNVIYCGREI